MIGLLLLLLLGRFSHVRICATPQISAHQAPPSLGFSRQEYWSGLPLPFPHDRTQAYCPSCPSYSLNKKSSVGLNGFYLVWNFCAQHYFCHGVGAQQRPFEWMPCHHPFQKPSLFLSVLANLNASQGTVQILYPITPAPDLLSSSGCEQQSYTLTIMRVIIVFI